MLCTECVGAQTQMSELTHVFERLSLLLHRVVAAAESVHFDALALYLRCLTRTLALYERTYCADAGTGGDLLQHLGVELGGVYHDLYVLDCRTVVERDEVDSLRTAVSAHPTLYVDLASEVGATESVNNFCSFHYIV